MKILIVIFSLFIMPCCLKAQTFPLGRSKEEVREFRQTIPHSAMYVSQSDTSDVYQIGTSMQEHYYYKKDICYRARQVYSLEANEVLSQELEAMQLVLNTNLKKLKENVWINVNGTEQTELI